MAGTVAAPAAKSAPVAENKRYVRRPWLRFQVNPNTGRHYIKDGIGPQDMPWIFSPSTGEFRFANVTMKAEQNEVEGHRAFGSYTKPRPAGNVNTEGGLPIFTFDEVSGIFDECEKTGRSLRDQMLRTVNDDAVTKIVQRKLAAAPQVYVQKGGGAAAEKAHQKSLDDVIANARAD
jgi:hypothetical protein